MRFKVSNINNNKKLMVTAGFEPAHPEIVGLKSTALDHSAKLPYFYNHNTTVFFGNITKIRT